MTITLSTPFLQQALTHYDQQFYTTVYPEKWAANGMHHFSSGDLPLGLQRVIAGRIDYVGSAAIWNGKAQDIPVSDFGIELDSYGVRMVISGAEWNMMDLQAEQLASANSLTPVPDFVATKLDAMRMAIDNRMHDLIVYGNSKHGMDGLFTGGSVASISTSTDLYALSAYDLYLWFRDLLVSYQDDTLLTTELTEAVINNRLYNALTRPFVATSIASGTPYEYLTDPSKGPAISKFTVVNECRSGYLESNGAHAAGLNRDLIVLGPLTDSQAFRRRFHPLTRTEIWQTDPMNWRVFAYTATTEAQFRQPYKFRYVRYPKYSGY
jgi:hypothetical protein